MAIKFSADEIFEIAEQIERNGAAFYRKAADAVSDDQRSRQAFLDLAEMELQHEQTFAAMRAELSDAEKVPTVFDPDNEIALYLRAFADGQVFGPKTDPAAFLVGSRTIEEILHKAIDLEKDSIVFYVGMQEVVPERLGTDKVRAIIREEIGHIAALSKKLSEA